MIKICQIRPHTLMNLLNTAYIFLVVLNLTQILIKIDKNKKSDDELDAIAIALTASAHLKF